MDSIIVGGFDKVDSNDPLIVGNLVEVSIFVRDFSAAERYASEELKLVPKKTAVYFDLAMIKVASEPKSSLPAWHQ